MLKSILDGVDDIINQAMKPKDIGKPFHYKHKKSCQKLSALPPSDFDPEALLKAVYKKVKSNWNADRDPSEKNWRFEKQTRISGRNKSPEVMLERAIANIPKECWPDAKNWVNQVPTASGLVSEHSDKRGSIDLAHRCGGGLYEFIELKVKSNNPLYAAIEIFQYGILYILARTNKQIYGAAAEKKLLNAATIHLKVLAPCDYYEGCKLDWLEHGINDGLKRFLEPPTFGFRMDFKFEAFPPHFSLSPFPKVEAIKEALEDRRSVYP